MDRAPRAAKLTHLQPERLGRIVWQPDVEFGDGALETKLVESVHGEVEISFGWVAADGSRVVRLKTETVDGNVLSLKLFERLEGALGLGCNRDGAANIVFRGIGTKGKR